MTLLLSKFRSSWVYLALLLYAALEFFCFSGGHNFRVVAVVSFPFMLAALLAWLYLQHTNKVSIYAFPVYTILILGIFVFPLGIPLYEAFFIAALPFLPLILIRYLFTTRQKHIPGSGAILIMFFGFLVSVIYQTIKNYGNYDYSFHGDALFFLAFSAFFLIYALLALGILSLRHLIMTLACISLARIVYIVCCYLMAGDIRGLLFDRFGDYYLSPNQTAGWIDLTFPLAVFLAIREKNKRIKIFFSSLSIVYALVLLACSSRGSMIGFLAVPLYFMIRSKSIMIWVLVVCMIIGLLGVSGGRIIRRITEPSRLDMISTIGRVYMAKAGYNMLKENKFLFGIGMDNFRTEKTKYGFPYCFDHENGMSSHDSFLELWMAWGVLGLIGWISLILGSIIRTLRARLPAEVAYLKPALIFSIFGFTVHSFFDSATALFCFLVLPMAVLACMSFLCSAYDTRKSGDRSIADNTIKA
jgi:hypothetical protein